MEEEITLKLNFAEYHLQRSSDFYSILTNLLIERVTKDHLVFEFDNKFISIPLGQDWNSDDNQYFVKFQLLP